MLTFRIWSNLIFNFKQLQQFSNILSVRIDETSANLLYNLLLIFSTTTLYWIFDCESIYEFILMDQFYQCFDHIQFSRLWNDVMLNCLLSNDIFATCLSKSCWKSKLGSRMLKQQRLLNGSWCAIMSTWYKQYAFSDNVFSYTM